MDPVSDLKGKEVKRACINELVDYITTTKGVIQEGAYNDIVRMVSFCDDVQSIHENYTILCDLTLRLLRLEQTSSEHSHRQTIQITTPKKMTPH